MGCRMVSVYNSYPRYLDNSFSMLVRAVTRYSFINSIIGLVLLFFCSFSSKTWTWLIGTYLFLVFMWRQTTHFSCMDQYGKTQLGRAGYRDSSNLLINLLFIYYYFLVILSLYQKTRRGPHSSHVRLPTVNQRFNRLHGPPLCHPLTNTTTLIPQDYTIRFLPEAGSRAKEAGGRYPRLTAGPTRWSTSASTASRRPRRRPAQRGRTPRKKDTWASTR